MSLAEWIAFAIILIGLISGSKLGWFKKIEHRINLDWMTMGLIAFYIVFYSMLKLNQFSAFITHAFDFSLFDYALFNTAHGRIMEIPFLEGSFLKEHFSPILFLYVPLYWIHSSPINLLLVQALHVGLAALPLYFIGRKLVDKKVALLAVFIYLNNWFVVHGLLYDFHIEMVVPLVVLTMIWAYLEGKYMVFWVALFLTLACKEDMSLYLAVFGLYMMIFQRKIVLGSVVFGIATGWFFFSLQMIEMYNADPLPSEGYKFLSRWEHFGPDWFSILMYLLTHPLEIIKPFTTLSVFQLVSSVGFLPLLSSWGILLVVPVFINVSSAHTEQANLGLYYAAPIIPFLMLAFLYGWKRLARHHAFNRIQFVVIAVMLTLNLHIYRPDKAEAHHRILEHQLSQMTLSGTVCAQGHLIPHLNYYQPIQLVPEINEQTDMVLVDIKGNPFPMNAEVFEKFVESMKHDENYEVVFDNNGFVVFKRAKR